MDKYECPCGYIYDPQEGDPESTPQLVGYMVSFD